MNAPRGTAGLRGTRLVVIVAFALIAAACGQYPGVYEQALESGEISGVGLTETGDTQLDGGGVDVGGTTTGGRGGGGATGGSGAGGTTGTTGGGGGPAAIGGDTTGVTDSTITIGVHAPLTGAAPLRASSFDVGKDLYWRRGANGNPVKIFGRTVRVVFQDDQYNPSHARLVCQQLAEQQNAFLLVGGAGTDQIQACAQYAASNGIPYLSAGVTEIGLRQLPNYFALSMSYAQQAPLLVQYMQANRSELGWNGDSGRVAMVATNTANFDDAVGAFQRSMPGAAIFRPEKGERAGSIAARLCTGTLKRFDIVFPLTAPTYYLEMAGAAKCNPQYVGVGITMGVDQVADGGCKAGRGTEGARFFSPAPAFADTDKFDRSFRQAGGSDDIMWLFWGLSRGLHELFAKAGPNLTREGFIASSSNASIRTGVFPDIRYTPQDRFGAGQVHVLRNVCSGVDGHYVTEAAFKSGF